jgi:hypothetical protein
MGEIGLAGYSTIFVQRHAPGMQRHATGLQRNATCLETSRCAGMP